MSKLSKKTKLALLVVLLAVVAFAGVKITSAWLTDTNGDNGNKVELTVGKVDYEIELTKSDKGLIVPGDDLLKSIAFTNNSTVGSQFRMKIEYSVDFTDQVNTSGTADIGLTALSSSNLSGNSSVITGTVTSGGFSYEKATGDSEVEWWYYGGASNVITAGSALTNAGLTLKLNGAVADNKYVGAVVTIKITFQAKQSDHVQWSEISTFQTYRVN